MTEDQAREGAGASERKSKWIIDKTEFGRQLKSYRSRHFDRAEDLSEAIWLATEFVMKRNVIYAIESGEQIPSLEQFIALTITLNRADGLLAFSESMRTPIAKKLGRVFGE